MLLLWAELKRGWFWRWGSWGSFAHLCLMVESVACVPSRRFLGLPVFSSHWENWSFCLTSLFGEGLNWILAVRIPWFIMSGTVTSRAEPCVCRKCLHSLKTSVWVQETEFPRGLYRGLLIEARSVYLSGTREALPVWAQREPVRPNSILHPSWTPAKDRKGSDRKLRAAKGLGRGF